MKVQLIPATLTALALAAAPALAGSFPSDRGHDLVTYQFSTGKAPATKSQAGKDTMSTKSEDRAQPGVTRIDGRYVYNPGAR